MIKRIVCSLAAVVVLTSSVFAWDAYSFTGVYDIASASAPVLYASSDSSTDTKNSLDFTSGVASSSGVDLVATGHYQIPGLPSLDGLFSAGSINFTPFYLYIDDHFSYCYQGNLEWDAGSYDSFNLNYLYYDPFSVAFSFYHSLNVSHPFYFQRFFHSFPLFLLSPPLPFSLSPASF